jgi:regulator of extracellular matrix RemA (YlzA/DUF370 family)
MGYTVPLRFIRISQKHSENRQFDVAICATRIVAIMSTEIYQARKTISDERKNGTLINGSGQAKAKSAIFLDNGSVISSPLTVKRLMSMIEKSNTKANSRMDKRMRVFDVYDGEPDKDKDDETEDVDALYDDDDFDDDYDDIE